MAADTEHEGRQRCPVAARALCAALRSRSGRVAGGAVAAVLLSVAWAPRPLLVWNASASAPVGLYAVGSAGGLARGDMAIVRVPRAMRMFATRRGYLPANVPLVKRVAGMPGDRVCASGAVVRVNGHVVARRLAADARGRAMPGWSGCVSLVEGDYFFVMPESPASFDGRYFGVSRIDDVVGKAVLLWRR